jgi:methyl coenzyme M reductase alpha subunit
MMPCVGDTAASGVGAAMSVGWSEGGVGGWFLKVGVDKKDGV